MTIVILISNHKMEAAMHEVLEKYGYLLSDNMRDFNYESYKKGVDFSKPLKMNHSNEGDMDDDIIGYLSGKSAASWDMKETFNEMCERIGFYKRHPEYIGKINF
jgi:hypothetical protein